MITTTPSPTPRPSPTVSPTSVPTLESSPAGSCILAQGVEPCPATVSPNCRGSFLFRADGDIAAWSRRDGGKPCSVIEGSLTIETHTLTAAGLAQLLPLTA